MSNSTDTSRLDIGLCKSLAEDLRRLTHTSNSVLDEALLKNVKQICSLDADESSPYLRRTFELLLDMLKKPHSEIRYNALQIILLFHRTFQYFHILVESKLREIVEFTTSVDDVPLPPPRSIAREMERLMLRTVHDWYQEYGSSSDSVQEYYDYLLYVKKVNFQTLEILDEKTIEIRKQKEKREKMVNDENMRLITKRIEELMPEITNSKQILNNCLNLLIPPLDNFEVNELPLDTISKVSDSSLTEIDIHVDKQNMIKIEENDENEVIIENARGQYALIRNKFIVKVQKWITTMTKITDDSTLLKRMINLMNELQSLINKYNMLKFVRRPDSDSDMEEVSAMNADDLLSESIINSLNNRSMKFEKNNESDIQSTPKDYCVYVKSKDVTSHLSFDSSQSSQATVHSLSPKEVSNLCLDNMPGRNAVGKIAEIFEPIKWQCNAPLPRGGLCPRRDMYKCPFHGKVVPRDDNGKCINPNDEKPKRDETPDWQDPKLLAELKKSTGVDLKMPKKGQKRKKDGPAPLTDIKTKTPRQRLYDKLFKKTKKNAL